MNLDRMAVMTTACRRPYYLQQSLDAWEEARGLTQLGGFFIALGDSDRKNAQYSLIKEYDGRLTDMKVIPDRVPGLGPHRAIGEAAQRVFSDSSVEFLIFGEEDVLVSDDVLEYMGWAEERFRDDQDVLCVLAHNRAGQGWDLHRPVEDIYADQQKVRLEPYFNAWCWGTWRNRWEGLLEPTWDWDCTSGGPMDSGYDWNIHARVIPQHGLLSVVPDASRSQNIGREEGIYSTPETFSFAQVQSFREHRAPAEYTLVAGPKCPRCGSAELGIEVAAGQEFLCCTKCTWSES